MNNNPIQVFDDNDVCLIELEGQLDSALSPQLEEVLTQPLTPDNKKIIIDLEKVPVVTADGVRVLLKAYLNKSEAGLLSLKNPNMEVKQLLTTVGLEILIQ